MVVGGSELARDSGIGKLEESERWERKCGLAGWRRMVSVYMCPCNNWLSVVYEGYVQYICFRCSLLCGDHFEGYWAGPPRLLWKVLERVS